MADPPPIESGDVPQANIIARVVELVRAVARDGRPPPFHHKRDRAFYFQAARALGLVEGYALTSRGRALAELEGPHLAVALRDAFQDSRVGRAWLDWQGASSIDDIDAGAAQRFLAERSDIAQTTRRRRASTLTHWVRALQAAASGELVLDPARQLSLFEHREWRKWPEPTRFPHNERAPRVGNVLDSDFKRAKDWLLETGYSSLGTLLKLLAERPATCERIRLLLGTEPFSNAGALGRTPRRTLPDEIRDYWLSRGVSVLLSGEILAIREAVRAGVIEVRTAPRSRPIHAKIYVAGNALSLGSSNFTPSGLFRQSEANVRFEATDPERFQEARDLAEGLWTLGEDYAEGFLALLDELLRPVTWQEALARGCAAVLEANWATPYLRPEMLGELSTPLWPHQLQGIGQAMWVLENVGAVLVADAAGSGKTRMGAWLVRAAFDRQYRYGFTLRPSPLVVSPPAIVEDWERGLSEAALPLRVDSHGPLSNAHSRKHAEVLRRISDTELLSVDEAHNFLNASARTFRLASHYSENVLLFTATPINRSAADLLALVDLLGADNLSDRSRSILGRLRRHSRGTPQQADLDVIREEIRRFTVRRTRAQLNAIVDQHPDGYRLPGRRAARYPRHRAEYYDCSCRDGDLLLAAEIASLADQLRGVTRVPPALEPPRFWQGTEQGYVERVLASARALARYHVMKCLRSSRAALYEHVRGTAAAFETYAPAATRPKKSHTGDMAKAAELLAGHVPGWRLSQVDRTQVQPWLWDAEEHRRACAEDARLYEQIADLVQRMSDDRERQKIEHLQRLGREGVVVAFDSHVITLTLFHAALESAGISTALFIGEGGAPAKRKALAQLGLDSGADRFVALCSDAFSEGMNLQKASRVVHLDTPTVIRLAEQRAGRVDRMDSPHDEVKIWWPRDPAAFAPQRRDLLRERHEIVADLIGANLQLPEDPSTVDVAEIAEQADIEHAEQAAARAGDLYDAFRGVRSLIEPGGLVPPDLYSRISNSRARIQSCVSTVSSDSAWAFLVVGGAERRAPQWVFFESVDAEPIHDLSAVSEQLRKRLDGNARDLPLDDPIVALQQRFIERMRDSEDQMLPPRRRRALALLKDALDEWAESEKMSPGDRERYALLSEWLFVPTSSRKEPFADPRAIADAWLALLRPRIRKLLKTNRRRHRFSTLAPLREDLEQNPISPAALQDAFAPVGDLQPVEQRIVAMIVGVPETRSAP